MRVREAVLDATLDLLAERGWGGLTMEGVAVRAGTAKGTVYRWWSSKEELAIEALVAASAPYRPLPDTGSYRDDLVEVFRGIVRFLREPRARVVASLVFETSRNKALADALMQSLVNVRRAHLRDAAERAVARGELRPDVDLELLVDTGVGQLFFRFLVTHEPLPDDMPERLADLIIRGAGAR